MSLRANNTWSGLSLTKSLAPMYCPNCSSRLETGDLECSQCHASFKTGSAWKPLLDAPVLPRAPSPIFSGDPKPIHAAQSVAMFVFAGPLFPLFVFAAQDVRSAFMFLNPLAAMGAYAVGGGPALLTGLVYCVLSLVFVRLKPNAAVGALHGAMLGALATVIAAGAFFDLVLPDGPDHASKVKELLSLSVPAGIAVGLLSGWLLPVGRQCADDVSGRVEG
jgi:hypothetical protein